MQLRSQKPHRQSACATYSFSEMLVSKWPTQSQCPSFFEKTFRNLLLLFETLPLYSTSDLLIPVTRPVSPCKVAFTSSCLNEMKCSVLAFRSARCCCFVRSEPVAFA